MESAFGVEHGEVSKALKVPNPMKAFKGAQKVKHGPNLNTQPAYWHPGAHQTEEQAFITRNTPFGLGGPKK